MKGVSMVLEKKRFSGDGGDHGKTVMVLYEPCMQVTEARH